MTLSSICSINKVFFIFIFLFFLPAAWNDSRGILHCIVQTKKRRVNYLKGKRKQGKVSFIPREIISEDSVWYFF